MRRWNGVLFGLSLIAVLALMIPSFDSSAALAQNAPQAAGAPNAAPSEPPPANKAEWQQLHAGTPIGC